MKVRTFLSMLGELLAGRSVTARAIFLDTMEDRLLHEFFKGSTGYFVEVGANNPVIDSKTWSLEQIGWIGLLIEPQPELAERLRSLRRSDVGCFACGAVPHHGKTMPLYVAGVRGIHSSLNQSHYVAGSHLTRTIQVPIRTLESALREYNAPCPIDFLAIDTEGFDLDVLEGIDLCSWRPQLILIEDIARDLSTHRYLKKRGYRWVRRTGLNSWYVTSDNPVEISLFGRWQFVRKYYLSKPFRVLRDSRRLRHARHLVR
jgi:FkbM family methyltransferase